MALDKIRVLVFPAGSEIGMEIYNSLRYNLHVELFGASGKADHAKYVYDEDHYVEGDFYISKPDFLERFNRILLQLKIDAVFPTHDSIALYLAEHRGKLTAKILTSSFKTSLIAREKRLTYDLIKETDFCPWIYPSAFSDISFPVFLKPNIGQGGKGTYLVNNKEELLSRTNEDTELILSEYLPGEELSVDCFTNRKGELLFIGPRSRERIQIGISFHSESIPLTVEIQRIAEQLNQRLQIRGAWFFQIKKDRNDRFKLMEFAVRQASTMGLYRQLGVNFALLTLFDAFEFDIKILNNNSFVELDRCLFNRYKMHINYNRVYIDFDDTIVVQNMVNETAIRFLYQCKNKKIKIYLLTKHAFDLDESLNKYFLSKNLFDEIILLKSDDEKVRFINPENSIFIDNYFFDRERVSSELKIPVFDVDAIESLLL